METRQPRARAWAVGTRRVHRRVMNGGVVRTADIAARAWIASTRAVGVGLIDDGCVTYVLRARDEGGVDAGASGRGEGVKRRRRSR